jgi:uncharacterized protein HemY
MAFNDPLQWVIIALVAVLVIVALAYIVMRVLRTSSKVDRLVDERTRAPSEEK